MSKMIYLDSLNNPAHSDSTTHHKYSNKGFPLQKTQNIKNNIFKAPKTYKGGKK